MPKDYMDRTEELQVAVQFVRANMVRLRVRRDEAWRTPESEMVVHNPLPRVSFEIEEHENVTILRTEAVCLHIDNETGAFSFAGPNGEQLTSSKTPPLWAPYNPDEDSMQDWPHLGDGSTTPVPSAPSGQKSDNEPNERLGCHLVLSLGERSRCYGLGMTEAPTDLCGRRVDTWIRHRGADDYRTPYFWCSEGWSLFVRTARRGWWDFGTTEPSSLLLRLEEEPELELFMQAGDLSAALEGYTWLTGRTPELPAWALGNWIGGYWKTQEEVLTAMREYRRLGIPLDVIRYDSWWQNGHECDFQWDENFPDPEGFFRTLSELKLRLHLWIAHFVNHNCSNFYDGLQANAFLRNNDGSIPLISWWKPERGAIIDFTCQEAKDWWKEQLRPILEKGVAGFKIDGGNEGAFVTDLRQFQDGRKGREMHNVYPLIYADCVSEIQRAVHGQTTPVWIRAGYAGIQRYPIMWAGDQHPEWHAILQQVRAGLSAGLSGVSLWSSDGGGFAGKPDTAELYIRGIQWAFWNPVAQPFGQGRDPWLFGDEAIACFRHAAQVRNRLRIYIQALARESSTSGMPILRHLALHFSDDKDACGVDDQFMFGGAFLVAPLYEAGGQRRVYFPTGTWTDIYTGETISGPAWYQISRNINQYPVYLRGGVPVPLAPLSQTVEDGATTPLTGVWVHPTDGDVWRDPVTWACLSDLESAWTDADLCSILQSGFGAETHAANDVAFAAPLRNQRPMPRSISALPCGAIRCMTRCPDRPTGG